MGITNTIAQLKAYFETWHEDAYDTLHKSSSDAITAINTRVQALENWLNNTRKTQIDQDLKQFENFISGYVNNSKDGVTKTLRNLVERIDLHHDFIYGNSSKGIVGINSRLSNWTYIEQIDTDHYDSVHAYVNKDLRIVSLSGHIYVEYYPSYKNRWKDADITILPAYKPKQPVYFACAPYLVGCILTNGKVQFKSDYGAQNALYFNMYAMWHY